MRGEPERATPPPDQLAGETGKGRCETKGRASGARSVLRPGVEGVSPSADAPGAIYGVSAGVGAVGRVVTGSYPNPPPADPLLNPPTEPGSLPCLFSNNSIETTPQPAFLLTPQQKKSACALAWNIQAMAEKWGLDRLAFFTLTFAENVEDRKEAQRRWNSLASNVLRSRYRAGIRVVERQRRGAVHYHCVVVVDWDIRTGYSFERDKANPKGFDPLAPQRLRDEWAFWRATAPRYGFGRCEMKPIASTEEGIARYVGKYLGKHYKARQTTDKGWRLAEYWGESRMAVTRFGWRSDNAAAWRAKVRLFAQIMGQRTGKKICKLEDISIVCGKRWAYHHREFIYSLPVISTSQGHMLEGDGTLVNTSTGEVIHSPAHPAGGLPAPGWAGSRA